MKSKIMLSVIAASVAVVPVAAFAKADRADKAAKPASGRHMSHHMAHSTPALRTTPSGAVPSKLTPVMVPKAK